MRITTAMLLASGLAAGNFFYQFIQAEPNYWTALDRSFFQACALVLASFVSCES